MCQHKRIMRNGYIYIYMTRIAKPSSSPINHRTISLVKPLDQHKSINNIYKECLRWFNAIKCFPLYSWWLNVHISDSTKGGAVYAAEWYVFGCSHRINNIYRAKLRGENIAITGNNKAALPLISSLVVLWMIFLILATPNWREDFWWTLKMSVSRQAKCAVEWKVDHHHHSLLSYKE